MHKQTTGTGQVPVTGVPVPEEDVAAVAAVVEELRRAQQAADTEGFLALFREDAVWTTAHGRRLFGREEIGAFTGRVLPATKDAEVTADYQVEHVLFIRPDIASVKIRQRPVTRDGRYLDEGFRGHPDPAAHAAENPGSSPGTPTYVMAKDAGVWLLAAGQNTVVIDPEVLAAG